MSDSNRTKRNKLFFKGLIFLALAIGIFFLSLQRLQTEGEGAMAIRGVIIVLSLIGILTIYISGKTAQREENLKKEKKLEEDRRRVEIKKRSNETKQQREERGRNEYLERCEKENKCPACGSSRTITICQNCYSENICIISTDHYDDAYCIDCEQAGRNQYKLKDVPCHECQGTGKWSRY